MPRRVLIAHAVGDEAIADQIAARLTESNYEVTHRGTIMVGDSVLGEQSKLIADGVPIVLCGTVNAVGTGWAEDLIHAARYHPHARIFPLRIEKAARVERLLSGEQVAEYWQDATRALTELTDALNKLFRDDSKAGGTEAAVAERRYVEFAIQAYGLVDAANLTRDGQDVGRLLDLSRIFVPIKVRPQRPRDSAGSLETFWNRAVADTAVADPDRALPAGLRLAQASRLLVLGEPGSGKSTLIRWMATAYLLRMKGSADWRHLPGIDTLPNRDWLPVVIRCRELNPRDVGLSIDEMLLQVFRRAALSPEESSVLRTSVRHRLEQGRALLLIDGVDEILDPLQRAQFCHHIEALSMRFPAASFLLTSRPLAFRHMGNPLASFERVEVAELSSSDMDEFASRWAAITEPPERAAIAAQEFLQDVRGSVALEGLASNPLLLTAMAVVRRSLGRLPRRRVALYEQLLRVFFRWRAEVDAPLEEREAIPPLAYVAYAMCDGNRVVIPHRELLSLLERAGRDQRWNYRGNAQEFLGLLEQRTGLLTQAGVETGAARSEALFRFRHMLFQQYLAARALADGEYADRREDVSLADHVFQLLRRKRSGEPDVSPQWSEVLPLVCALLGPGEAEAVLSSVGPRHDEHLVQGEHRHLTLLAGLCLVDTPGVTEQTAAAIIEPIATLFRESSGDNNEDVQRCVKELSNSPWADLMIRSLAAR